MYKIRNRRLMAIIIVVLLWCSLFVTDFVRVSQFEKPIFCVLLNGADDGGSGTYVGLGYTVELDGNFMPEDAELRGVTQYDMKLFGIFRVQAAIRC